MGFEIGDTVFLKRIAEALEEQNHLQEKQNDLLRLIVESLND